MTNQNIGNADYGALDSTITDYSVDTQNTDGAGDQNETSYTNDKWPQQFGYYQAIPELRATTDAKATWTVGNGFIANPMTTLALSNIKGFGKDTFNTILENAVRTKEIAGDSFGEIIRDKKDKLVNVKPLDPGSMKIIANRQGIIIRYEQIGKVKGKPKKFRPEQIFHLSKDRIADQIHGSSIIDQVEWIILAKNEAMADVKKLMHRHVFPVIIWHLDTDKDTEIAAFKVIADKAYTQGENLYIPKGAVVPEVVSVSSNATLNSLPWISSLDQKFYQATGVPQIIVGGSVEITEASAKIVYLAFEQMIKKEQLYIEEQVLEQLGLEIELEFPASLQSELLSDSSKSETMQAATPEDTNVQGVALNPPQQTEGGPQ